MGDAACKPLTSGHEARTVGHSTRSGAKLIALLCAEAGPWRCHRNLIADALTARGVRVRHILSATRADEHALHRAARPGPDGTSCTRADDQLELR